MQPLPYSSEQARTTCCWFPTSSPAASALVKLTSDVQVVQASTTCELILITRFCPHSACWVFGIHNKSIVNWGKTNVGASRDGPSEVNPAQPMMMMMMMIAMSRMCRWRKDDDARVSLVNPTDPALSREQAAKSVLANSLMMRRRRRWRWKLFLQTISVTDSKDAN